MSWLSKIFSKVLTKTVLDALKSLLVKLIGDLGKRLSDAALEEVKNAEKTDLSGTEKLKLVVTNLRARPDFKNLPLYALNIAIEGAVAICDPKPIH